MHIAVARGAIVERQTFVFCIASGVFTFHNLAGRIDLGNQLSRVAFCTFNINMLAGQWVTCAIVGELLHRLPRILRVALRAVLGHLTAMFIHVTVETLGTKPQIRRFE